MPPKWIRAEDLAAIPAGDVEDLNLVELEAAGIAELDHPAAARVVDLTAAGLDARALQQLAKKPLPALRRLNLKYCELDSAVVAALFASPLVQRVDTLALGGPMGGAVTVAALTASPLFPSLDWLEFYDGDLGDDGCAVLAQGASRGKLRKLGIGRPQFGIAGDASNSKVGSQGCIRLVESPALSTLENLGVSLTEIDAALAQSLLHSPLARFFYPFPGSYQTRREAPAGGAWLSFQGEHEMPVGPPGGAYYGTTTLSNARTVKNSGGSGIFSADGRHAAIPIWEQDAKGNWTNKSFVRLISMDTGVTVNLGPSATGSLALYSFDEKRVCGISNLEDERAPYEAKVSKLP